MTATPTPVSVNMPRAVPRTALGASGSAMSGSSRTLSGVQNAVRNNAKRLMRKRLLDVLAGRALSGSVISDAFAGIARAAIDTILEARGTQTSQWPAYMRCSLATAF
jgi:hypothetical protein